MAKVEFAFDEFDIRSIRDLIRPFTPIPTAFEFDETPPTTYGFVADDIRDDGDKGYSWGVTPAHFRNAQFNQPFPMYPPVVTPRGSLVVSMPQFGSWAKSVGFPQSSAYWYIDIISPLLVHSSSWQAVNGVEAWLLDNYSAADTSHLSATLWLNVGFNGLFKPVYNIKGSKATPLQKNTWQPVKASFSPPSGAEVRNLVIRVAGEWSKSSLPSPQRPQYEGQIFVDHIVTT